MKAPTSNTARVHLEALVAARAQASVPQLHVPSWVPHSVADYARAEWEGSHDLLRLTRDPRMRRVWHELSRQHRDGTFMHPATIEGRTADERQNAAMAELFRRVWYCKLKPHATVTRRTAEQNHERLMEQAKDLTEIAATLTVWAIKHEEDAATLEERLRLVMGAVQVIKEYAAERLPIEMRAAVERDHGDGQMRWFVLAVAEAARALFGSPLYGLTATVASVALEREIEPRTVRQWCTTPPCG